MDEDFEDRIAELLESLRLQADESGPGRGVRRFARTLGSAASITAGVWSARKRAAQGGLDESDLRSFEGLVRQLGHLKGLPMKFGQVMGFLEADLPEEMRRLLALLQTQSQPSPWRRVAEIIGEDLGERAGGLLQGLSQRPASVASIGQVHRGRLPDGTEVAVKVRHDGIDEAIESDFAGASVGSTFARLMVPGAGGSAKEFVEEARERLLEECDYELEARRQRLFRRLYAGHTRVIIPGVQDEYSGRRVLTTTWESGKTFEEFAKTASREERDRIGRVLFDFYIGTLYRHGLFHADPHPGNYLIRDGQRLVVFDFGCVREFDGDSVLAFARLADAMRASDDELIRKALADLGAEPPHDTRSFAYLRVLLEGFFAPMLREGPHRVDGRIAIDTREMMRSKLAVAKMRLPAKLLFLFRIRFGLYSVLSRLGAVCDWSAIERSLAEEAREDAIARVS